MIVLLTSTFNRLAWYHTRASIGDLFQVELFEPPADAPYLKGNYVVTSGIWKGWLIDEKDAVPIAQCTEKDAKIAQLEDACKTVVNGYESDGMEQMSERDEVFYQTCKNALQ